MLEGLLMRSLDPGALSVARCGPLLPALHTGSTSPCQSRLSSLLPVTQRAEGSEL